MARGPFSLANPVGIREGIWLALAHLGFENESNVEFSNEEIAEKMEGLGILTSAANPAKLVSVYISNNREKLGIQSSHGWHSLNETEMSKAKALFSIPAKLAYKRGYTKHQKEHAKKLKAKLDKIIKG